MKKGQVAIVSAVMIVVLVILAILLSGYLFYDKDLISVVATEESGVFYFKFSDYGANQDTQYVEGDCCNKYTTVNYDSYVEEVPETVVYMDSVHYVPGCNSCNQPKTYTYYHKPSPVEVVTVPLENTFYVGGCGDCTPKDYTMYHREQPAESKVVYMDNVHYVKNCCC